VTEGPAAIARSSWRFEEGDEIVPGRYAVRLLGGGHAYEAYLAWDDKLHSVAVAKIVRPHLADDASSLVGLERESRALRFLNHPVIVRSFETVLTGDRPHLVLEFLDGPRLSTLIRRHGVVTEQLLALALELCAALHYMSTQDMVHLDVKPRNVIMSAPPRLVDLSVARSLDEIGTIASPIGTDAYMAPEQCVPDRFSEIGPPSDIWGLGVTLYEALAHRRPFPNGAEELPARGPERYPQLDHDPSLLAENIPRPLAQAILSCLEKHGANRPTAAELAEVLEPWVAALPRPRLGLFRPGGRVRRSDFEL